MSIDLRSPSPEQLTAVEERGSVFVSAGAGTGKTTVLVERFVRALVERGLAIDAVLVITYTERAAGELRTRIRARLVELGRDDLARDLDRAWISTIHGLCFRLLRSHPFGTGIDPRFRVLDESQARILAAEAFREALTRFCGERLPERLRLLATYGAAGLSTMLMGVYDRLRSAGRPLELAIGRGEQASERDGAELEGLALRDRDLLQQLLGLFDDLYRAVKAREAALDFEDLQLLARDLLSTDERLRQELRWRIRSIMVDEFQDTNQLQCELIDLLCVGEEIEPPDLFLVGDELQSIYRFRHADVEVFRERRALSPGVLALRSNYRSRPELLSVVNRLFEREFGESFTPLVAGGRFAEALFEPAVELLVTDKASYEGATVHWRTAEARHVAHRVRELVDQGAATPGEVVLLFRAGGDADLFEQALREEGLPTHRATGRGYFGQQQVVDLLAYLRLLHNRYDDEALVTVLASPLVGVSNDALVLLRRAAARRPLFCGLERGLPPELAPRDHRLFEAFKQRYERLARIGAAGGLEGLCDRIVAEHDYDLAVLARWDGRRRYANLRKLARLARSFEELRGPDIEGFIRFVRDQAQTGAREVEAAAEEEGGDAVRLLTIHAAKGLEFPVVVVADMGRSGMPAPPDEILVLPDGRFGFRVLDPVTGKRQPVFGYEEVRAVELAAEQEESRRLTYVAMTRAVDRLIVSGSLDPASRRDAETPIAWVLDRLEIELGSDETVELEREGARVLLRVDRYRPQQLQPQPRDDQLELFATDAAGAAVALSPPELAPLPALPEPASFRPRRLSYTALALFERCPYRFYAERVAGLASLPVAATESAGLTAIEIGDAVHVALERSTPVERLEADLHARYPNASAQDVQRIRLLVEAWRGSKLARELAALEGLQPERAFAFEHEGVLLHGRFDLFRLNGGRALVVDYKTNLLKERSPVDVVEREYRLQRLVYALAAFRAGAEEVEVVYCFLESPDEVVRTVLRREGAGALEQGLSGAIDAVRTGHFPPRPSEPVCAGCPVLNVVCAGPGLLDSDLFAGGA